MGIERDQFYIGERVLFDVDFKNQAGALVNAGTTSLVIQPPGDAAEVTPSVTITPLTHAHAEFVTAVAGWHEWRWASTGTLIGAKQGRFRVLPLNV
jgi:hypothetical protein